MPERALAMLAPGELIALVLGRAPEADEAWRLLVEQHVNLVWKVVRSFGMTNEASWDAFQGTWLRAIERLETLREPERFTGWLKTIARNEALAVIRARKKLVPTDELDETGDDGARIGEALLREEQARAVRAGFAALPVRCQQLLRLLCADPRVPYEEIERRLDMKHGSIGPTRRRCLEKLRSTPAMTEFLDEEGDGSEGAT